MHGAHNTAYKNITTELNTCIDSDDYMPCDAVENIISFLKKSKLFSINLSIILFYQKIVLILLLLILLSIETPHI